MTSFSHRGPYTSLSPTPLQHNSCSRRLPANPLPSTNRKQQNNPVTYPMPRSHHHTIHSNLRTHSKRYQKNHCFLHLQPTRPDNRNHRYQSTLPSIPPHLHSRILQSYTIYMFRIHYPQPK
uniref:Uncharacterized protein n=1 Tax=Parascaris equorum TaxID=6256 RepID=A0A914SA73_PAREQ